ncbi:type II secretion system protein N [Janthinobacterium sp. MDT1-19]|uniref:type II secretion system protein N n=1 Tax=Janthinobacterium sp. MDT1-19 TaxID=1259339 RepID=UPI003F277B5C
MKRLPQFTSLLAVVALSVSLAYWAMQLFKAPQRPINPPVVPVVQDASVEAGASLFGGQVSVATASNYQLKGVVATSNGRGSVAIISTDGKPSVALPEGAEVAPGVTVLEVHARHVLLRDGGVSKRIDLVADDKALALPAQMSATPSPSAAPAPTNSLVPPPLPMEQQRAATMMPAPQVSTTSTPPSN